MWNLVLFEIEKCSIHLELVSRAKSMCDVTLTPSYGSRFERLRFGSQQADWQFALLTNPKPKLMVFRSLDVSRKYTCFLYVFLSTKKSFDMNISRHEKFSQLLTASDHFYHQSEVLGPHTAGNQGQTGAQTGSRSGLVSYDCNLKCCSPIATSKNHK